MADFGKADGSIVIKTWMDTKDADKGLAKIQKGAHGLSASLKKIGSIIGAAFAVRQIVNFGKECVELGSNVAEVQNVVDVAFGDMADKVEEFANSAIQNFGMSRLAAKKTASTYMAMAKGMGVPEEAAADMSITLAGLTGDIASFYNISQELADTKLKSVFTGETESLKDLGIVMTQTNLKAYALSRGITKGIESMSQAELVTLRYNFALDQLALAQGDFVRTSDSWANQTRILTMQWEEFMSIIGQTIITVLTPLVKVLNSIVSYMISMANAFNTFVSDVFGGTNSQLKQTQSSAEAISGAIGSGAENQDAMAAATKNTAKEQKKLLAGFDEINRLTSGESGSSGGPGSAGGGVGGGLATANTVAVEVSGEEKVGRLVEVFKDFRQALQPAIDSLHRLHGSLVAIGEKAWAGLKWGWDNILKPLGSWTVNDALPKFLNILSSALDVLNATIGIAAPAVEWLWDRFLGPIAEFAGGNFLSFLDGLHGSLEIIAGLLTGDFDRAAAGAKEAIKSIGDQFSRAKNLASLFWGYIKEDFAEAAEWLGTHVVAPVSRVFNTFLNGLISGVEGFINFFILGINKIIGAVNSLSFEIPEVLGGGTIGFSIPTIKDVRLPRLATGAVIPPNREFLAVLGDQSSGTNIEAPLSTIEQALENVLNRRGGTGEQTAIMECDKIQFGKLIYRLGNSETARHGVSLTEVRG